MAVLHDNTNRIRGLIEDISALPKDRYDEGYELGKAEGYDGFVDGRSFVLTGTATVIPDWGFQNISAAFEIDLPYLTTIKGGGFYGCKNLIKVNLPLVTTTSGSDFNGCTSLTDLNLPLLSVVSTYAFKGCTSLNIVDFPSAKDIWGYAFNGCTSLETLILRLPTMCTLRYVDALAGTPIESGTGYVYVPDNLVEQYKAATNWSVYSNQIKPISELED